MKIPTQAREGGLQFNLTPLIDVVFQLIIFFLVASYLSSGEDQSPVQLAKAPGGRYENEAVPRRVMVTLEANGIMRQGQRVVSLDDIKAQLRAGDSPEDVEFRLRADARVPYQQVEPILVTCAEVGITRLQFHVLAGE